jgi:hypothetical protein
MGLTMTISFEIPIWAYISFAVFVWYFSVGLVIKQTTKQIIAERGALRECFYFDMFMFWLFSPIAIIVVTTVTSLISLMSAGFFKPVLLTRKKHW